MGLPCFSPATSSDGVKRGNNNAYCQDNEVSWLDWDTAETPAGRQLRSFVTKLIALRQEHAALRSSNFLHGHSELAPNIFDIAWFEATGESVPEDSWKTPDRRLLCLRRAMPNDDGSISLLALLLNPSSEDHEFVLPPPPIPGSILVDTSQPDARPTDVRDHKVTVQSRSVVLVFSRLGRHPP